MKFKSIPQEIEAIQYGPDAIFPYHVQLRAHDGVVQVYNPLHNSWIGVKEGDWIRTDLAGDINTPGDVYPITDEYMKAKYKINE